MTPTPAKSTSKKRVRRSAAAARDTILDAAERVLLDHGPQEIKVAMLAKESGIGHPTILHHFGSISNIHKALVVRLADRLIDELSSVAPSDQSRLQVVPELVERTFKVWSDPINVKLVAWLALTNQTDALNELDKRLVAFRDSFKTSMKSGGRERNATNEIISGAISIATMTAIGEGIGRAGLSTPLVKDLTKNQIQNWITELILFKVSE